MLKDSKSILDLSEFQSVNHKIVDEYRERLKSFEDSLWFGKSDEINAIECSRRGWRCRNNDLIECANCHALLNVQLPSVLQIDQYKSTIEHFSRSLVDAHYQYCVWRFMTIPQSIIELNSIYSRETINRYLHQAECFLAKFSHIDIVGRLNEDLLIESNDFDLLSSSHLNDVRLLNAFKIVAFCWQLDETNLICEKCCRQIKIPSNQLTIDPILSHRTYCPILRNQQWKQRISQIDSILHKRTIKTPTAEDQILHEILSTQDFFHQLISSKEYYRSCVQTNFDDQTSTTHMQEKNH